MVLNVARCISPEARVDFIAIPASGPELIWLHGTIAEGDVVRPDSSFDDLLTTRWACYPGFDRVRVMRAQLDRVQGKLEMMMEQMDADGIGEAIRLDLESESIEMGCSLSSTMGFWESSGRRKYLALMRLIAETRQRLTWLTGHEHHPDRSEPVVCTRWESPSPKIFRKVKQ